MKKIGALILFLTVFSTVSLAQKTQLKGVVVDALTQEEIAFATIAVYNNSEIVDGNSADEKGRFQLLTNKKLTHIEVSFIGYKRKQLRVSDFQNLNELYIELTIDDNNLETVIIEGKPSTTQLKIDRKIINLGSDIQNSGVNALEAFDQIPEIETDIAAGTISLRGSDNIRVLINGKPSALSAVEVLQQLPTSHINKVELITSPSAKYQADGISGILNIILKKNSSLGLNLALNSSVGTKRHGYGISGNYNLESVNFRLTASKANRKMIDHQTIFREFTNGYTENIVTPYRFDGIVYTISSGMDLYIKDQHELSFEIDYIEDTHDYFNNSSFTYVTDANNYQSLRMMEHFHYNTIFNTNYRLKFDENSHFLEFDYNLNISNNDYPLSDLKNDLLLSKQFLTEDFVLQALAMDYTLPVSDKVIIETGLAWNSQALESQRLFSLEEGGETNNVFNYNEQVFGAYAMSKFSLGTLNLQAGLRYEYFKSISKNDVDDIETQQKFSNVFPSVHLSYVINDNTTLNLGYSKRVSRPNFHHVNAFQVVNPLFIWEYNPNVTPEFSDNIELSYQKRIQGFNLGLSTFYRHRKDVVLWRESVKDEKPLFRYENSGIYNSYGVETTATYKVTGFWDSRLTVNYYFTKIAQSNLVTWDDTYSSTIQFKNTIEINKKITADISYLYLPKRQSSFNYVKPRKRLDLSVRGKFIANKLLVNLRLVDIFNSYKFKRISKTGRLNQTTIWDFQSQTSNFLLSLNYKLFENKGKTRQRKDRNYNEAPID